MNADLHSEALRMIVESLPTGAIIVDAMGQIVLLNHQIETWFGFERNELLGHPIECLIPNRFVPHHSRYRDEYFSAPVARPMGAKQELFAKRKDGSEFPCDISLHPLPLKSGMHVLVHLVDATSRKQEEARQRHEESLHRLQFIVENLPAGAAYVSLDTRIILINQMFEELTGYSQRELSDLPGAFRLLFRDRMEEMQRLHDQDREAGFPAPREILIHRKDGKRAWIEFAAYRYNNHEVWLWHDITERLAAQARSLQSVRLAAIGEMMTGLAHESRNALQRARAALDMLELDLGPQSELRTFSRRAVSAVDELQRLYEEVRNYAAPIQLEWQVAELEEIWRETCDQISTDKQIVIESEFGEGAKTLSVDRYRVKQVLRNILENAVAVLPETGGTIKLTTTLVDEEGKTWLELAIQDNGPGMTEEQKTRIFEPFFTTKIHGTGLGMAIVRRIMDAHSGTASVGASERGAKIILRFPM